MWVQALVGVQKHIMYVRVIRSELQIFVFTHTSCPTTDRHVKKNLIATAVKWLDPDLVQRVTGRISRDDSSRTISGSHVAFFFILGAFRARTSHSTSWTA